MVISKDGVIGDIYDINGLKIAIPKAPRDIDDTDDKWVASDYPKDLSRVRTIFDWNRKDNKFKSQYVDLIEREFDRREDGHWFMNDGSPTYVTGTHYMYLQWTKIDIGRPDFRESTGSFTYFGRPARLTSDASEFATSRTGVLGFHLCHHPRLQIQAP